jgi:hypothetical protein
VITGSAADAEEAGLRGNSDLPVSDCAWSGSRILSGLSQEREDKMLQLDQHDRQVERTKNITAGEMTLIVHALGLVSFG